jgi:cleavage stimulation factor subunit 2
VVSFRLVYDRDTGRPKGFGFAEYTDPETAASAVRNLDDYEILGRKLRVDFSHEGNAPEDVDTNAYMQQPPTNSTPAFPNNRLPPLPPGYDFPIGMRSTDAISQTLKQLPVPQLLEILGQMKTLVVQDPIRAKELLRQAPQLSYAIFQALLLMNLVDTQVLSQVLEAASMSGTASAPAAPAPSQQSSINQQRPIAGQTPYYHNPPSQQSGISSTAAAAAPQPQHDPHRAQLLQSVMQLTPDQIAVLPVEHQQQINYLRQTLLSSTGI